MTSVPESYPRTLASAAEMVRLTKEAAEMDGLGPLAEGDLLSFQLDENGWPYGLTRGKTTE